jgi:hypothetical protein
MCFGSRDPRFAQARDQLRGPLRQLGGQIFGALEARNPRIGELRGALREPLRQVGSAIRAHKAQHQNPAAPPAPRPTQGSGLAGLFGPPQ